MGDLLKELLFEGPAQLVDIARSAGIDIESLSYVDFDVDPEEETCLYWLVVRRAHEIARDKKVKKVSVEHLFVALFERIADEDYPSVARKAIFKQGLDPVVILAHIREELQPPKSKR